MCQTRMQILVQAALKGRGWSSVRDVVDRIAWATEPPDDSHVRKVLIGLLGKGMVSRRCGRAPLWLLTDRSRDWV